MYSVPFTDRTWKGCINSFPMASPGPSVLPLQNSYYGDAGFFFCIDSLIFMFFFPLPFTSVGILIFTFGVELLNYSPPIDCILMYFNFQFFFFFSTCPFLISSSASVDALLLLLSSEDAN